MTIMRIVTTTKLKTKAAMAASIKANEQKKNKQAISKRKSTQMKRTVRATKMNMSLNLKMKKSVRKTACR